MSNTLVPQNNNTGVDVKTIPSYEVAEMMPKKHWEVLRMLEGYEPPKGSKSRKVVGIIPTLNNHNVVVVDYFIESTYVDAKGETRKCYECTKMGCELLANKMTGEKGILFTAKYVKKFNDMEKAIEQQVLSAEQIVQMIDEAVKAATAPIMDRLEKLIATKEAPKSEQISFIKTPLRTPYTATKIGDQINRKPEIINKVAANHGIITKTNNGWVLNKKYEEAGYGKTCNDGQWKGTFVRYSEKGAQEIIKIFKLKRGC